MEILPIYSPASCPFMDGEWQHCNIIFNEELHDEHLHLPTPQRQYEDSCGATFERTGSFPYYCPLRKGPLITGIAMGPEPEI